MRRVLIDECLPVQLHQWLKPFESRTVAFMGWKGLSDAELLQAAGGHFEVLVTSDGLLPREHDLAAHGLGVVIVPTNLYRGCTSWFRPSPRRCDASNPETQSSLL